MVRCSPSTLFLKITRLRDSAHSSATRLRSSYDDDLTEYEYFLFQVLVLQQLGRRKTKKEALARALSL